MVADNVSIATAGARNEDRTGVVALLGNVVMRPMAARNACEGELVVRGVCDFGPFALASRFRRKVFRGNLRFASLRSWWSGDTVRGANRERKRDGRWCATGEQPRD